MLHEKLFSWRDNKSNDGTIKNVCQDENKDDTKDSTLIIVL